MRIVRTKTRSVPITRGCGKLQRNGESATALDSWRTPSISSDQPGRWASGQETGTARGDSFRVGSTVVCRAWRCRLVMVIVVFAASAVGLSGCTAGPVAAHHSVVTTTRSAPRTRPPSPVGIVVSAAPWRLPAPLAREVVLASGGELLVAGGLTRSGSSSTAVLRIDPASGSTHPAGRLAVAVHDAAGALLAGHGVIFGGGQTDSVSMVQALRPHGPARLAGHLPRARSDLVAATIGNAAYLLGGYNGQSLSTSVLRTTNGRDYHVVGHLAAPVRYPAIAARGNQLWVFGGQGAHGPTDVVQRIDVRTGQARIVGHLGTPLAHASALVVHGDIYLAGGQTRQGTSDLVRRFDPSTATFTVAAHLPVPVRDAGAAVIGDTGYLLGGGDPASNRVIELRPRFP
ncbi:MAG: hypothetical protein ACRDRL_07140 [Sciscionella sp.]